MGDSAIKRVVITGTGVVSSIGVGRAEFLSGLRSGHSAVKPISAFDTAGFAHAMGCEVVGFAPEEWIQDTDLDTLGRASQFSVSASRMAVEDSGLTLEELGEHDVLVAVGTTDGEARDLDTLVETELHEGPAAMAPQLAARVPAGRLSAAVAYEFGLSRVEAVTLPTACAAGNYAIGYGFDAIRSGDDLHRY